MNQYVFAAKNIFDKLCKISGNREIFKFYWKTYFLSKFKSVEPDVYIVSYPKCGRTWLRIMLGKYIELIGDNAIQQFDKSILQSADGVTIKFEHDQGNWVPAPLKIKQLSFKSSKYSGKKTAFLVRDPRDVLISSWYHLKFRERIYTGTLSDFIRDDLVGIRKIIAFMNMWIENCNVPDSFSLFTYEMFRENTIGQFKNLLYFTGIPIDETIIKNVVEQSSFKKMKQLEKNGTLKEPWMKPGNKNSDNSMKIRKGKVGSFREELSEGNIAFLNEIINKELSPQLKQFYIDA